MFSSIEFQLDRFKKVILDTNIRCVLSGFVIPSDPVDNGMKREALKVAPPKMTYMEAEIVRLGDQ